MAAFICCLLSSTSCARVVGNKKMVTKRVEVGEFHAISTSSGIDVIYTQSTGSQNVEIYASENVVEHIEVVVEEGVLKIGVKKSTRSLTTHGEALEVHVTSLAVNDLRCSSSGDIKLTNGLQIAGKLRMSTSSSGDIKGENIVCEELILKASSSGDIDLNKVSCNTLLCEGSSSGDINLKRITAESVTAKANSSSEIKLNGKCKNATFEASSSGDVVAKDLVAINVFASATSSGDISCYATDKLTAKTSSSGEITYRGTPQQIDSAQKVNLKQSK